jgi:hypothetical protein
LIISDNGSEPVPRIDDKDGSYSSGCTLSYWLDSLERPKFSKLTENKKCDFLVVGAGIGTYQFFVIKSI